MSLFEIVVDPPAARDLKKFKRTHPRLLIDLIKLIDSLAFSPYQGKPLKGDKKGCYSLRENDYRIIYEVYPHEKATSLMSAIAKKFTAKFS